MDDPIVVCGREWNPGLQIVADTASEFDMKDPLYIQFRYGTGFDFASLKVTFYEVSESGVKGSEIWNHVANVSDRMSSYTLQGKTKHSDYMTARALTRHKEPGKVMVEISTDNRILASKIITLVRK